MSAELPRKCFWEGAEMICGGRSMTPLLTLSVYSLGIAFVVAGMNDAMLPQGVKVVWDISKAYRELTPTRERICINGLWRWQPAQDDSDKVPTTRWGYFKVRGSFPGITNYIQKDCQSVFAHPSWKNIDLSAGTSAWYQREVSAPREWANRRIALYADYINSFGVVYIDGKRVGEMRFPSGEVDLTAVCQPGGKHTLSMPLKAVMLSYNDTASARKVKGRVARRGLCGDVYLVSTPPGPRITDVRIDTSVRKLEMTVWVMLDALAGDEGYTLRAQIFDKERKVVEFTSEPFGRENLVDGRFAFSEKWKPDKMWDIHTPENMYELRLSLLGSDGEVLDSALPIRFGFRELWIEGRDFYLNGTRIYLSAVPLDNAQVGAYWASYEGARKSRAPQELLNQFRLHPQLRLSARRTPQLRAYPQSGRRCRDACCTLPATLRSLRLE